MRPPLRVRSLPFRCLRIPRLRWSSRGTAGHGCRSFRDADRQTRCWRAVRPRARAPRPQPDPGLCGGRATLGRGGFCGGPLVRGRCSVVIGVTSVCGRGLVPASVVRTCATRSARRRLASARGWRCPRVSRRGLLYPSGALGAASGRVRARPVQVPRTRGRCARRRVPCRTAAGADAAAAGAYSRLDPGPGLAAESADIWLWPDVDGWFSTMHVVAGLPYRVEVRRPACRTESFGVRVFQYAAPWGRRLRLEADQCVAG